MRRFLALTLLLCVIGSMGAEDDHSSALTPTQEIQRLITYVENSEATFIRNGARHDASAGADHLRLKLRRGAKYAKTAEDFIANLATKSSWSGKPYLVEHVDGKQEHLSAWLLRELKRLRAAH